MWELEHSSGLWDNNHCSVSYRAINCQEPYTLYDITFRERGNSDTKSSGALDTNVTVKTTPFNTTASVGGNWPIKSRINLSHSH